VRYIRHRMEFAGLGGVVPFDADAHKRIYRLTRGVPRQVNRVCDRALLGAYSARSSVVDAATVQKAWDEVTGADTEGKDLVGTPGMLTLGWPAAGRTRIVAAIAGAIALALLAWWLVRAEGRSVVSGAQGTVVASPGVATAVPTSGAGERSPR